MIINSLYKTQNLPSLWIVSFLVGLRTYHKAKHNNQKDCKEQSNQQMYVGIDGVLFY